MGTPIGAEAVGGEKAAGMVRTGEEVRAARIPLRPDWDGEPMGTTRFFCSGSVWMRVSHRYEAGAYMRQGSG